ncbi:hypothetical protein LPJ64_006232, partial [Coemansia asiatica]
MQPQARSNSQLQTPVRHSSEAAHHQQQQQQQRQQQQRLFTPRTPATVGRSASALSWTYTTPQNRPSTTLLTTSLQHQQHQQKHFQQRQTTTGTLATAGGNSALRRGGRRLSEAGVGNSPSASASASVSAWRGEQFPGLPAPSSASSAIVRSHTVADPFQTPTAHNERRSESRGSMYSVASAHGFLHTPSSGKQPVLVRSVRLDLKVVPPELDAAKAQRKEAARGELRQNQHKQQLIRDRAARVRVRMDVSVHVLHAGEQRVDLLSVAEPSLLQRSRVDRRGQTLNSEQDGSNGDSYNWPKVERTACAVAGLPAAGEYAESAASPLVSPVQQPAALDETPVPGRRTSTTAATAAERDRLSLSIRRSEPRPRPQTMFHIDELSPYPPAP